MSIKKGFIVISIIIVIIIILLNFNYEKHSIVNNNYLIKNNGNRIIKSFDTNNRNNIKPIAYLSISKIGLNKALYSINSYNNNVNYNIEINKNSDMPNIIGGNMILEAHSGDNYNSFFRNLYKLDFDDKIDIVFNNYNYKYIIKDIYYTKKNGFIKIKRDYNKSTVTLITCTKDNDSKQTVYIAYLEKKECLN